MSDEKFEFISDEEIEQILGKQEDESMPAGEFASDSGTEKPTKNMEEPLTDSADETEKEEVEISPVQFREFTDDEDVELDIAGLRLLYDVPVEISVVLGSVSLEIGKLSKLAVGTKIPLKKLAGEPVEVYIGDVLIARGETVVVENENTFGVRIIEILSEKERILSVYETLKKQKQL